MTSLKSALQVCLPLLNFMLASDVNIVRSQNSGNSGLPSHNSSFSVLSHSASHSRIGKASDVGSVESEELLDPDPPDLPKKGLAQNHCSLNYFCYFR